MIPTTSISRCCAVCGDSPAKIHYGVLACFGCKGFFRRAVKDGRNKYVCRFDKNCEVNKNERNACRYCRFRRCLFVGMNPDFVRPDREDTKSKKRLLSKKKSLGRSFSTALRLDGDDWTAQLSPTHKRLLNTLNTLDNQLQGLADSNYEGVAQFSLKSLIADRTLARQTGPQTASTPSSKIANNFLAIERIVSCIDYIDGFLASLDNDVVRRISVEDKCSLISDCFLPLSLLDTAARLVAKNVSNFSEDLMRIMPTKNLNFKILAKFNRLCEFLKKRAPSTVEFSIFRALLLCSADVTLLSNLLGDTLSETRELLQELLFRAIKLSRRISSVAAASAVADFVTLGSIAREVSVPLHSTLESLYPIHMPCAAPFSRILTDIFHPEVSDLVAQAKSSGVDIAFSPPNLQLSPRPATVPGSTAYSPMPSFTAPLPVPVRPRTIGFSPKLPLTITKSIEEMLRAPGAVDDSVLNRPLASDWADNFRLTPVFSKDVVAQFFPELGSGNL